MPTVGVVAEGQLDLAVASRVLQVHGVIVDGDRRIDTGGKTRLDARLEKYNAAARHGGWLVLRDSDRDAADCPANLRTSLLSAPQSPRLCLRFAVRAAEAWLLADQDRFTEHFGVPRARIPVAPDQLVNPKQALVDLCLRSKRRDVREGVGSAGRSSIVGPEYTARLSQYCRDAWRPLVAAESSESLSRALADVANRVADGRWS